MATVTNTGVTPVTLEQYITALNTAFRSALGDNLDVSPATPTGNLIGSLAMVLAQADEGVVNTSNASGVNTASGTQLDGLFSALGISRNQATRSTVTASLTGVATSLIPAGSRARTSAGDVFRTTEDVTLASNGTATVTMESVEVGPIAAASGTLINIVDTVVGWETVTNAAAASLGRDQETDPQYRQRYLNQLSINALEVQDAIVAAVRNVTNVREAIIRNNDNSTEETIQGLTINANSIAVVVDGGADIDIARAIRSKKGAGTNTNYNRTSEGATSVPLDNSTFPIGFYRVQDVAFELTLGISVDSTAPSNVQQLIRDRITQYVNGTFNAGGNEGFFELDGLTIAEALNKFRLFTPINSVQGVTVNSIVLDVKGGASDVDEVAVNLNERVVLQDANQDITINIA